MAFVRHVLRTVLRPVLRDSFCSRYGAGLTDEQIAIALSRNIKVWALFKSGDLTGTSAQVAGYAAGLTI